MSNPHPDLRNHAHPGTPGRGVHAPAPHGPHGSHGVGAPPQLSPDQHDAPDEWHRHGPGEELPQEAHLDQVDAKKVIGVGLGLFVAVHVVVGIVYGFYVWYTVGALERAESVGPEGPTLVLKAQQQETLARGYAWANADVVVLPISQGIDRVVERYAGSGGAVGQAGVGSEPAQAATATSPSASANGVPTAR